MQQASEKSRSSNSLSIAAVEQRRVRGKQNPRLVQAAETLLDDVRPPSDFEPAEGNDFGLENSAMCQWLADLTYHVVKCAHVGIAYIDEKTQTLSPFADAGPKTGSGAQWWTRLHSALFSQTPGSPGIPPLARDSIVVQLPAPRARRTTQANGVGHPAYVVPISVGSDFTAIFAVEPRTTPARLLDESVPVLRAMAGVTAATLQAHVYRHMQNKQATQAERAMREAVEEMDGALTLVSHELKSPLTTVMACLQYIRPKMERLAQVIPPSLGARKTVANVQDMVALADRYARIENRIATDLVEASRIHSGRITLNPRPYDLVQIVREAVAGQRVVSPTRIIHLDAPDRRVLVSVDPDRVAQVVTNFLVNALKYSHNSQPVEVRVRVRKNRAQVAVRDYGPGLEKSELKRVWERFYRVEGIPAHTATGSGLGLGLYISREIIRGHGGVVGATSIPGHGATFWFTLSLLPTV